MDNLSESVVDWLNDDTAEHTRLAVSVGKMSVVCRSKEIGGYLWHTGRIVLPDGRRFRIAWSKQTDLVAVGRRL